MLIPIYDRHKSRIHEFILPAISVYCFTIDEEFIYYDNFRYSKGFVVDHSGVRYVGINIMVFHSCTKTILDPFLRSFSDYIRDASGS